MTNQDTTDSFAATANGVPAEIVDAVRASIDGMQSTFFGEEPVLTTPAGGPDNGPCIAGIVSFLGDVSWSLAWILTGDVAPSLVRKMAGLDISFESSEIGDAVGELANVLAGEVAFQLDLRQVEVQISLPTVVRGNPLEVLPETGPAIVYLRYTVPEGPFWLRISAMKEQADQTSAGHSSSSANCVAGRGTQPPIVNSSK